MLPSTYKGAVSLPAKWGHPHDRGAVISGHELGTSWCMPLIMKLGRLSCAQCRRTHTLHLKHLEARNISGLAAKGCASVARSLAHGCLCCRRLGMLSPMLLDRCCCAHRCGTGERGW